jgi:lysophospholipase L1-like esterase
VALRQIGVKVGTGRVRAGAFGSGWLALPLAAALVACDGGCGSPRAEEARATAAATFGPGDPRIRYVGRVDASDPARARFAWPATGFAFRFSGTSLALELDDVPLPDGTEENDWLAVAVDGTELAPVPLASGRRAYRVAADLPPGAHLAEVAKRTEAEVGTASLLGIALDPGAELLPPPAAPARVIEIVGDSISTGFGIDGKSADCPFSAATEDATGTYAALAARAFGAEARVVAWKGKGVLRNDDPTDPLTLPTLYERLLPGEPGSRCAHEVRADVVVLNLGTNDFARSAPPDAEFRAAYAAFVDRLRAVHPEALLVLALGPMLYDEGEINYRSLARAAIEATVADRRARGDAAVEMIELWSDPADGVGCQVHPNRATHRRMAGELARLIEARLGWRAAR